MFIQSVTAATSLVIPGFSGRSRFRHLATIRLNKNVNTDYFDDAIGHAQQIYVVISGNPELEYRSIGRGIAVPITMGPALQCDATQQGEV